MKKNKYNFVRCIRGQYVLYNALNDKLCLLDSRIATLYNDNAPLDIENIHPTFYKYLCANEFIIDDDVDEYTLLLSRWKATDEDNTVFSLSVNPTLNCNMCCWYCYEKHSGKLNMSDAVLSHIKTLIEYRMSQPQFKAFHLGFFGGEPLLNFDKIAGPLIEFLHDNGIRSEVGTSVSFVTNGFLITPTILNFLELMAPNSHFQITIDGNEMLHDAVRFVSGGKGSYRRILENIALILTHKSMAVVVRCNYTGRNIASFQDVASDLAMVLKEQSTSTTNLSIDFHRVWQDSSEHNADEVMATVKQVKDSFRQFGFNVTAERRSNRYRCYAERRNHALVNFNGDLYRCTARDFVPEKAEGKLSSDGQLQWNERSRHRDAIKWSNKMCTRCLIYPLCCGSCSQSKLENMSYDKCDYGYDEAERMHIVDERIIWLLEQSK